MDMDICLNRLLTMANLACLQSHMNQCICMGAIDDEKSASVMKIMAPNGPLPSNFTQMEMDMDIRLMSIDC